MSNTNLQNILKSIIKMAFMNTDYIFCAGLLVEIMVKKMLHTP